MAKIKLFSQRDPALDGLRGVAILGVMLFHLPFVTQFGSGLLAGGWLGVTLFFVLSGYLITTILLKEYTKTGSISFRNFYFRRLIRLAPALIVFLSLNTFVSFFVKDQSPFQWLRPWLGSAIFIFNWLVIFKPNFLPVQTVQLWSLSVEEQFYLIWPAGLYFLLSLRLRKGFKIEESLQTISKYLWVLFLIPLFSFYLIYFSPRSLSISTNKLTSLSYFGTLTYLPPLLCGLILALILTKASILKKEVRLPSYSWAAGPLLALIWITVNNYTPRFTGFLVLPAGILSAVVVLRTVNGQAKKLNKILASSVFCWLGRRSYALYLYTSYLYVMLRSLKGISSLGQTALILIGGGLLAEVSWRLIENPLQRKFKK